MLQVANRQPRIIALEPEALLAEKPPAAAPNKVVELELEKTGRTVEASIIFKPV